jgi:hypothetical protein
VALQNLSCCFARTVNSARAGLCAYRPDARVLLESAGSASSESPSRLTVVTHQMSFSLVVTPARDSTARREARGHLFNVHLNLDTTK